VRVEYEAEIGWTECRYEMADPLNVSNHEYRVPLQPHLMRTVADGPVLLDRVGQVLKLIDVYRDEDASVDGDDHWPEGANGTQRALGKEVRKQAHECRE